MAKRTLPQSSNNLPLEQQMPKRALQIKFALLKNMCNIATTTQYARCGLIESYMTTAQPEHLQHLQQQLTTLQKVKQKLQHKTPTATKQQQRQHSMLQVHMCKQEQKVYRQNQIGGKAAKKKT